MEIREGLFYTKEHEWVAVDHAKATVGITDYAQGELGDIVFMELPAPGSEVKQMEPFGTIEAVKAVSSLFSPVSGVINEVNTKLEEHPDLINSDPYGEGWIVKISMRDEAEIQTLLSSGQYRDLIGG